MSRLFSNGFDYSLSQSNTTFGTISPYTSKLNRYPDFCTKLFKRSNFSFRVRYKFIDGYYRWNTELDRKSVV